MSSKQLSFILLAIFTFSRGLSLCAQVNSVQSQLIYSTNELNTFTDTTSLFTIKEIIIEGNQKTKEKIILRELPFTVNEQYSLSELIEKFAIARQQLINSSLFQDVVVSLNTLQGYDAAVKVSVLERFYIFPIPFIKVVDQNLQQWVTNSKMDMGKVKYGIKTTFKNVTGRNDRLAFNITNGFTKELAFRYEGLPLDNRLHWSGSLGVWYGQNRDFQYATVAHKALAYRNNENFVHNFFKSYASVSYRPAIKTRHSFTVGYINERISDTLLNIHQQFHLPSRHMRYPEFGYRFEYYNADFIPYPTKGYVADFSLTRKGLNSEVGMWQFMARTSASWPLSDKYFFNLRTTAMLRLPFKQPYVNQRFVGGSDLFLQGYEDYEIDGVAGGYTKATFTRKLLQTAIHIPSTRIKKLKTIPIKMYGKVYGNAGYIYAENADPTNTLNNRLLYSGGVGLDIVLFYDLTLKLEWSWNHLRQNGLYLHDRRYL
jgi:outer membrane protein assembly factor BamA